MYLNKSINHRKTKSIILSIIYLFLLLFILIHREVYKKRQLLEFSKCQIYGVFHVLLFYLSKLFKMRHLRMFYLFEINHFMFYSKQVAYNQALTYVLFI